MNKSKQKILELLKDVTLYQLGTAERFELVEVKKFIQKFYYSNLENLKSSIYLQESFPYRKAIDIISKLPFLKTVNDKLDCLVKTCQAIDSSVKEYYSIHTPENDLPLQVYEFNLLEF